VSDDYGEDGPTRVDDPALPTDSGEITPIKVQRCPECGSVIFDDGYSNVAASVAFGMFTGRQCVRAHDGHWHICANYSPTHDKLVMLRAR